MLDESADSAGEVTGTTVTRVEGGLEIQTNEHKWTKTFSVSYPGTAPETLAENESSLTDEPKEYTFSIGNEDISLKSYEWAEDNAAGQGSQDDETLLIPLEPSTPVTDPISDGTDSLESEEETPIQTDPSIETQEPNVSEPSEEPEVPESEQQEGGDTPVEELETPEPNQSGNSAEQEPSKEGQNSDSDQEDEESDQRAEAATKNEVGESADYETMTLSAAAVYSEDGNDSDQENSGEDAEEKEPTTYFQGVTVIFTDQEEEQAPENPEFMLSLSTESENSLITPVDRKLPDFTFTATAKLNEGAAVEKGDSISFQFQIQLPEGITFPEGTYFSEVGTNGITVQYTGTDSTGGEVITIPLPEGVTVKDIGESDIAQVSEDLSTLTLSITQSLHVSAEQPEGSSWTYAVTVHGAVLEIADGFTSGTISITSDPVQESGGELAIQVDPVKVELDDSYKFGGGKTFQKTIYWRDNNDEGGVRPETGNFPIPYNVPLQFRIGGEAGQWVTLDESNMADVGLTQMPKLKVSDNGNGVYMLTYEGLNTQRDTISPANPDDVTKSERIDWQFGAPPVVAGYDPAVVDDGAGSWTYCLLTDFNFTAQLRWGDLGDGSRAEEATKQTFALYKRVGNGDPEQIDTLGNLEAQGKLIDTVIEGSSPIVSSVMITDLPGYTADGMPITYFVDLAEGQNDMELDLEEGILPEGDKLTAGFDNTTAPSHSTDTDKLYDGGRLTLTLSGTTRFSANKVWLDQADNEGRPNVTYTVWRYREGASYREASQLTEYEVTPMIAEEGGLKAADIRDSNYTEFVLSILDGQGRNVELPKYDTDGYEYVYFLKETMTPATGGSNSYEQIFGVVKTDPETGDPVYENGKPVIILDPLPEDYYGGNERKEEDQGIYNLGTVSNRLTDKTTASLNKTWKASAFQGDLENVTVTFRLQYRPADDPDSEWFNTDEIRTQNGVTEESMASWTESAQVDKYGPLGKKLVYRWVEESITQNEEPVELGPEEYIEDGQGRSILTRTFTLKHGETEVTYRSETVYDQETDETTITNTVEDTLDYYVTKEWRDDRTPKEITINLYRMVSGASFDESDKPYLTFSWNGNSIAMSSPLPPDFVFSSEMSDSLKISKDEDGTVIWSALLSDLPRFNENGQEYEYLLLEDTSGQEDFPIYKTERDEDGSYHTTVINGEGKGSMILVRKEWTDDTDIEHRGDVTIQVYDKETCTKIGKPVTIPVGVTTVEVGIDDHDPSEVFILETAVTVDGKTTNLPEYSTDVDGMALLNGTALTPTTEDGFRQYYATQYHRYEATYRDFVIGGSDQHVYVVNNRRLGNIDLTVTKNWVDGEGQLRDALEQANAALEAAGKPTIAPYLKLVFAEDSANKGTIAESTVTINDSAPTEIKDKEGQSVQSMQEVDFSGDSEDTQTYYFYNLPKYDKDGAVLHYEVEEVWVVTDKNGGKSKELTPEELYEWLQKNLAEDSDTWKQIEDVLSAYSTTITTGEYTSADEDVADPNLHDSQPITVTNQLGNTKMISWTKHWNDKFTNEQNQRPDLYLDIYRMYHGKDEKIVVELFREDYIWTPDESDGDYSWTVTLPNVQKYDSLGYEIFYYAVERTKINFESYDYEIAQYSYPSKENSGVMIDLGSRDDLLPALEGDKGNYVGYGKYLLDMTGDSASDAIPEENKADYPNYALLEGGTITNGLSNHVTIQGRKVWVGTGGFPEEDLPAVTFAVDRYTGVKPPEEDEWAEGNKDVATITVSDWAAVNVNGTYTFTISRTGKNTMVVNDDGSVTYEYEENSSPLPRYDENGSLYTYVLREESVEWAADVDEAGKEVLKSAQGEGTYVVENTYTSPKGSISVKKHLELPTGLDTSEGSTAFPSIQFKLTRTYTGYVDGEVEEDKPDEAFNSDPNNTITWDWTAIKEKYENIESSSGGDTVWVSSPDEGEGVLVFNNLDLYAPNGSRYVYTVEEVVEEFLYGYTTSSGIGKLERDNVTASQSVVGNLFPVQLVPTLLEDDGAGTEPDSSWATFKNALDQKTVTLKGSKIWDDYDNVFNLRPGWDVDKSEPIGFSLALSRYANSQVDENGNQVGNQIPVVTLSPDTYTITWKQGKTSDGKVYNYRYRRKRTGRLRPQRNAVDLQGDRVDGTESP